MGFWDFLRRGKSKDEVEGAKYVLKRRTKKGGMTKVQEFAEPVDMEDLYEGLIPGFYALHKYQKGTSGFEQVWGIIEVTGEGGEEDEDSPRRGKGTAIEQFLIVAQGMAQLKEEAAEQFAVMAPFFGFAGVGGDKPKTFLEEMEAAKGQFDTLKKYFGDQTTGAEPITYEGAVPIWLHPQLIPELLDTSLEKIEKRLTKWGIVDEEEDKRKPEDDLPAFPEKPKPKTPPDDPEGQPQLAEEVEKEEEAKVEQ